MLAFITGLIPVMKGAQAFRDIANLFVELWIKHDIDQIGGEAASKEEEYEVIRVKLKESRSDIERRALLRALNRLL